MSYLIVCLDAFQEKGKWVSHRQGFCLMAGAGIYGNNPFQVNSRNRKNIPRKIILSPYAKKCIVFYHIFRWYWANTSTLSLSACKQSAGIGSIPALCGLIFHIFVISQFFLQFFVLFDNPEK